MLKGFPAARRTCGCAAVQHRGLTQSYKTTVAISGAKDACISRSVLSYDSLTITRDDRWHVHFVVAPNELLTLRGHRSKVWEILCDWKVSSAADMVHQREQGTQTNGSDDAELQGNLSVPLLVNTCKRWNQNTSTARGLTAPGGSRVHSESTESDNAIKQNDSVLGSAGWIPRWETLWRTAEYKPLSVSWFSGVKVRTTYCRRYKSN